MSKIVFPIISDDAAVREWRKHLLVVATVVPTSCTIAIVLMVVAIYPEVASDISRFLWLLAGAVLVNCCCVSISVYCTQCVVELARARVQSARRFLQDAGHELATPVAILRSRIQVMERSIELDEANKEDLDVLSESTGRLSSLVDDIRALAQAEAPRTASDLYIINLGELVRSICSQMKDTCESRSITVSTNIKSVATIIGQRESVERAVSNLISNAIKYGRDGGKVDITIEQAQAAVILMVEDDGIGIAPDDLPKIFDRFYQGEKTSNHKMPGSGLGLAIVKAVVESHSGKVHAESELGKFTRVVVEFPKSPVHPVMKMLKRNT